MLHIACGRKLVVIYVPVVDYQKITLVHPNKRFEVTSLQASTVRQLYYYGTIYDELII
jgi:hypothetical protein